MRLLCTIKPFLLPIFVFWSFAAVTMTPEVPVAWNDRHLFFSDGFAGWLWLCLFLFVYMSFQSVIQIEGAAPIWDMLFSKQRPRIQHYAGTLIVFVQIWHLLHLLIFCWPGYMSKPGDEAKKCISSIGRQKKSHGKGWEKIIWNIIQPTTCVRLLRHVRFLPSSALIFPFQDYWASIKYEYIWER